MPRGGRRSGTPGKSYGNRSDLQKPRPLPVTTAPGQAYGAATQQQQDQTAVPMASGDLTATAQPGPSHDDLMAQAAAYQPPNVSPLRSPSQRPGEPLMTPPPPPATPPSPLLTGVALLNALGSDASPEVKALRSVVSAGQANGAAP